jgi:translocation and assembly module TamA
VLARSSARIPATQLFRTGGDTTVRGYGYRDIGVGREGGVIAPGRYLAVGSVEWQRPIRRAGAITNWESTLFVDGGAVSDRVGDLRPAFGVGTGVRWKSPLGPVQADLAYGLKSKKVRLHLNIGVTF